MIWFILHHWMATTNWPGDLLVMAKLLTSDIVQQTNICSVRQGATNTMKILNIHMIWNHQILKIMIVSIKERTYLLWYSGCKIRVQQWFMYSGVRLPDGYVSGLPHVAIYSRRPTGRRTPLYINYELLVFQLVAGNNFDYGGRFWPRSFLSLCRRWLFGAIPYNTLDYTGI